MTYRPEIDGLRAIAVLAVLFYHAKLGFSGGFVGVDVFFVISGFLITSVIVNNLRQDRFSFARFWEKRVKRLVPALALTTIVTAMLGYLLLLPEHLNDLGGALVAQPLLLANVYFWRVVQLGYFAEAAEIRPLLHTWSLGVEEQFYVLFPLVLVAAWGRQHQKHLAPFLITALAGVSLILSILLTPQKEVFSFFMLPTRAWELLLGSILAFAPPLKTSPRHREGYALLGLAAVIWPIFAYNAGTTFPGISALLPCAGTALIIYSGCNSTTGAIGWCLSHPSAVFIGKISYSLYLWHWTVFSFGAYVGLSHNNSSRVVGIIVSLLLGYLSWKWVETPFRQKDTLLGKRSATKLFAIYALTSVAFGVTYLANRGFPDNWSPPALQYAAARDDSSLLDTAKFHDGLFQGTELGASTASSPTFLLLGDSHAMAIAPVLNELATANGRRGIQLTYSLTPPLLHWDVGHSSLNEAERKAWKDTIRSLARNDDLGTIILAARWEDYFGPFFSARLEESVDLFLSKGKSVFVVLDVAYQEYDVPRLLALEERYPVLKSVRPFSQASSLKAKNDNVREALKAKASAPKLFMLDPYPYLVSDGVALEKQGDVVLYRNPGHLTSSGSMTLRALFEPVFGP